MEYFPKELPQGWTKEIRFRKTFPTGRRARKDTFYIEQATGYLFRSLKDAYRYILNGERGLRINRSKKHLLDHDMEQDSHFHTAGKVPRSLGPAVRRQLFKEETSIINGNKEREINPSAKLLLSPSFHSFSQVSEIDPIRCWNPQESFSHQYIREESQEKSMICWKETETEYADEKMINFGHDANQSGHHHPDHMTIQPCKRSFISKENQIITMEVQEQVKGTRECGRPPKHLYLRSRKPKAQKEIKDKVLQGDNVLDSSFFIKGVHGQVLVCQGEAMEVGSEKSKQLPESNPIAVRKIKTKPLKFFYQPYSEVENQENILTYQGIASDKLVVPSKHNIQFNKQVQSYEVMLEDGSKLSSISEVNQMRQVYSQKQGEGIRKRGRTRKNLQAKRSPSNAAKKIKGKTPKESATSLQLTNHVIGPKQVTEVSYPSSGTKETATCPDQLKENQIKDLINNNGPVGSGELTDVGKEELGKESMADTAETPKLSSIESFADPCIQFAFKTLTHDIPPWEGCSTIVDYFRHTLVSNQSPCQSGSSTISFATPLLSTNLSLCREPKAL